MNRKALALSAAMLFAAVAPAARAASDEATLVTRAGIVVHDLRHDKEFGNAPELLRRAHAIFIVPQLVKGGFFVGGEGGSGVMLARTGAGWSEPAFYTMGSASFGLQIGLETAEVVMLIMSDRALNAFTKDEFKIGADAGLTVVTLGSNAGIATTANLNADVIVWASSSGAYAGISVNGSIIKPRDSWNEAYYGSAVTSRELLARPAANGRAVSLRGALTGS